MEVQANDVTTSITILILNEFFNMLWSNCIPQRYRNLFAVFILLFNYIRYRIMKKVLSISFLLVFIVLQSCKDKKLEPTCNGGTPTYDNGISEIINAECTNSLCHGPGSSQATFTSYAGLSLAISNGNFNKKVLVDQTMPRNSFLTQDQLDLIKCWVDNGYPENQAVSKKFRFAEYPGFIRMFNAQRILSRMITDVRF